MTASLKCDQILQLKQPHFTFFPLLLMSHGFKFPSVLPFCPKPCLFPFSKVMVRTQFKSPAVPCWYHLTQVQQGAVFLPTGYRNPYTTQACAPFCCRQTLHQTLQKKTHVFPASGSIRKTCPLKAPEVMIFLPWDPLISGQCETDFCARWPITASALSLW